MDLMHYVNQFNRPQERITAIKNLIFRVLELVAGQRNTRISDKTLLKYIEDAKKQDVPKPLIDACVADYTTFIESAIDALWRFDRYSRYKVDETILQKAVEMLALPSELKGSVYIPRAVFGDAMQFLKGYRCYVENLNEEETAIAKVRAYFHGYEAECHTITFANLFSRRDVFSNKYRYNVILACVDSSNELMQLFTQNLEDGGKMAVIMPSVNDEREVRSKLTKQGARVSIKRLGLNQPNIWLVDCSKEKNDIYSFVADSVNDIEDQTMKERLLELLYDVDINMREGDNTSNNFNTYRKILEWICSYLCAYGFIENYIGPNQLTALMREISSKEDKLDEDKQGESYEYIIPPYVNYSMQACNNAAQSGSHQHSQTTRNFCNGTAPYLDKSVLYNLLNVLYWALSLPKNKDEILGRLAEIKGTIDVEGEKQYYIGLTSRVEKTDGVYHITKCKINPPKGQSHIDLEDLEITIKSVGKNQGSSVFLFYTNDYEIKS